MMTTASITDLKQNTAKMIKKVQQNGKSIVILQRSQAAAVLVDPQYYAILEEALENKQDLQAIEDRKLEPTVSLEKVAKDVGL